jgi:hypothetical protein
MKIRIPLTLGLFATLLSLIGAAEPKKATGAKPRSAATFFNGKDLTGWSASEMKYWSVKDGAIVGHSAVNVPGNKFIWADGEVEDFYLVVEVKLTPDNRNAGIQFRSKKANASGQAVGYQADVGAGVWGKLYHEHGRGKLDWNNNAAGAVKPGDWNRYEILAVGHNIWTAINGKLCVALDDPKGELTGQISFQVHGGPAQTVHYRNPTLIHNPKIALEKQTEKQLLAALPKKKAEAPKPAPKKPISTPLPYWTRLIMAVDPGSQGEVWAKLAFDHAKWKTMEVPGHFENSGLSGYDGVVWFRKTIELSAEQAKSKAVLNLGQIDDMDVTWVNGKRVGGYENPGHHYTVRKYPIPTGLLKTGKNAIAVRVMDHGSPGGMAGKPEQLSLQLGKDIVSLANLWHFAPGANLQALNKLAGIIGKEPALLRPLAKPSDAVSAFAKGFALKEDATIVILGGSNAAETQRFGYLETLLAAAHPDRRLTVRNMAWPADTVFNQQRPRNFFASTKPNYGEMDRRIQTAVDVAFLWLGQAEALGQPDQVDEFASAYEQTLEQLAPYTKRIVVVTPVPFEDPLSLGLDLEARNSTLGKQAAAMRRLAQERDLPVVDLFRALNGKKVTSDGQRLSPRGHWLTAQAFAEQLGYAKPVTKISHNPTGGLQPASAEKLRLAVRAKDVMWRQFWVPPNWAFLYGNRQTQPSSRSHSNRGYRWFPEEIQTIPSKLVDLDRSIYDMVRKQ